MQRSRRCNAVIFVLLMLIGRTGLPADEDTAAESITTAQQLVLDSTLEDIRRRFKVPGLAIGIVENGSLAYARGFGVRDTKTGAAVTTDTLFHIASISKTFTATAILQLVEQRKISLDDPLERYLPAFANSGITISQLLTHTAGFSDWSHATRAMDDSRVAAYVAKTAAHRRAYPPGKGWEYNDTDFNILGAVIEAASGQTYPDYVQQHVLAAAGMSHSTCLLPSDVSDFAWPNTGETFVRRASHHPWDRVFIPSSGIEASVTDLMRWAVVNLKRDPALLTMDSYDALFEHHVDTEWPDVAMGLGWQLERRDEQWLPRHPGGDPGFRSLLTLYPETQRAIVILANGETTPRWEIRGVIEDILAGKAPTLPN